MSGPPIAPEQRPIGRAIAALALLGVLFFSTYAFANWAAGVRGGVPIVVFEWESRIPFVAWTILPYWSIDLLYGISVLICRTREELSLQVRRLLTAQVVAIGCFLAYPLRFSFDKPPADGVFGALFDALAGFDKPFNQAPSLHIILLIVIWARLLAHISNPAARILLHSWMLLIGVSVLTTYQHHFIDIPTGVLAGFLCLWLWPERGVSPIRSALLTPDRRARAIGARYAAGTLAAAVVAQAGGGAWLWLWWPAVSLAIVAGNYVYFGVAGFQKQADGRLTVAAQWLLAPYLLGAWLNSRLWTRGQPEANHVADGVWLGRMPSTLEPRVPPFAGIIDLTAELPAPAGAFGYGMFPILDLTAPSTEMLKGSAQAIERMRADGPVLVCCALGYSRSACAVAAWLLQTGRASDVAAATRLLTAARPWVVLGPDHQACLGRMSP